MAHDCDLVDGVFLTQIARALCREIPMSSGEAAAGRMRLVDRFNQKIAALALPTVGPDNAVREKDSASLLIAEAIVDERLSAHTRNFLQTAQTGLKRFDEGQAPLVEKGINADAGFFVQNARRSPASPTEPGK